MGTTDTSAGDGEVVEIRFQPWAHPGEMKVYILPAYEAELRDDLIAAGRQPTRVLEFSADAVEWAVLLLTARGVWPILQDALTAFIGRHRGKVVKMTIRGRPFEARGYSADDISRLLREVKEEYENEEKRHRQLDSGNADSAEPDTDLGSHNPTGH